MWLRGRKLTGVAYKAASFPPLNQNLSDMIKRITIHRGHMLDALSFLLHKPWPSVVTASADCGAW
jgi:hypothetical protein